MPSGKTSYTAYIIVGSSFLPGLAPPAGLVFSYVLIKRLFHNACTEWRICAYPGSIVAMHPQHVTRHRGPTCVLYWIYTGSSPQNGQCLSIKSPCGFHITIISSFPLQVNTSLFRSILHPSCRGFAAPAGLYYMDYACNLCRAPGASLLWCCWQSRILSCSIRCIVGSLRGRHSRRPRRIYMWIGLSLHNLQPVFFCPADCALFGFPVVRGTVENLVISGIFQTVVLGGLAFVDDVGGHFHFYCFLSCWGLMFPLPS